MLESLLNNRGLQRTSLGALRRFAPLLRVKNIAVVSRYETVTDVLERPEDFSVRAIYEDKMRRTSGAFYLGMDDTEQYRRERKATGDALRSLDLDRYRSLAGQYAEEAVETLKSQGELDLVQDLSWLVPLRLCEDFFGISGVERRTLARWCRYIFQHLFLNLGDDPNVAARAERLAVEMGEHIGRLIEEKAHGIEADELEAPDFLSALVRLSKAPASGLDSEGIRRNVGGVILGSVDTVSKCVVNIVDELLERPEELRAAQQAALSGDREKVARIAFEALRFFPHNPLIVRHAVRDAIVRTDDGKEMKVKRGDRVFAMTYSAMFDATRIKKPRSFDVGRENLAHLQFGFGMHRCFGEHLTLSAVPEILMPLLRLSGLRRWEAAPRVVFDGPFPDHFWLTFERGERARRRAA